MDEFDAFMSENPSVDNGGFDMGGLGGGFEDSSNQHQNFQQNDGNFQVMRFISGSGHRKKIMISGTIPPTPGLRRQFHGRYGRYGHEWHEWWVPSIPGAQRPRASVCVEVGFLSFALLILCIFSEWEAKRTATLQAKREAAQKAKADTLERAANDLARFYKLREDKINSTKAAHR
jgi:hypothetical protein